ncbi:hypothetical protein GCM10009779_22320 [Polymorphospora rubra]
MWAHPPLFRGHDRVAVAGGATPGRPVARHPVGRRQVRFDWLMVGTKTDRERSHGFWTM